MAFAKVQLAGILYIASDVWHLTRTPTFHCRPIILLQRWGRYAFLPSVSCGRLPLRLLEPCVFWKLVGTFSGRAASLIWMSNYWGCLKTFIANTRCGESVYSLLGSRAPDHSICYKVWGTRLWHQWNLNLTFIYPLSCHLSRFPSDNWWFHCFGLPSIPILRSCSMGFIWLDSTSVTNVLTYGCLAGVEVCI